MFSSPSSTSSKTTSGKSRPISVAASRARSAISESSTVSALIFAPVPREAPGAGASRGPGGTPAWGRVREEQGGALPRTPKAGRRPARGPGSTASPQERPDAREDAVAVEDVRGDELVASREALVEVVLELARAVRALHLPVAEEVRLREE